MSEQMALQMKMEMLEELDKVEISEDVKKKILLLIDRMVEAGKVHDQNHMRDLIHEMTGLLVDELIDQNKLEATDLLVEESRNQRRLENE